MPQALSLLVIAEGSCPQDGAGPIGDRQVNMASDSGRRLGHRLSGELMLWGSVTL